MASSKKQMSDAGKALAAGGMASIAMMLGTPATEAAITMTGGVLLVDIDGNTANGYDLRIRTAYDWFMFTQLQTSLNVAVFHEPVTPVIQPAAKRFTATTQVSLWTGAWHTGTGYAWLWALRGWYSNWDQGQGYLGFRVDDGAGGYDYGWVLITPEDIGPPGPPYAITLVLESWGAVGGSSSGSGGTTGGDSGGAAGTPEPSGAGLALLALGAAGVMRQRRRMAEETAA